jgi:hypothetical protein
LAATLTTQAKQSLQAMSLTTLLFRATIALSFIGGMVQAAVLVKYIFN